MRSPLVLCAFAFAVMTSARAHAQELRVEVHLDPCVEASSEEVRRIVAIELRAAVWDPTTHDPATTRVDVGCVERGVELRVSDPLTAKSLARTIALGDVAPNARARLLALAISELVSASWTELESNPAPAVAPIAPPPRPEDKKAARAIVAERMRPPRERAWRLTAALDTRWMTVGSDPLFGVGARAGFDAFDRVGFAFDATLEHGSVASALGTVGVDAYSLGAVALVRGALGPLVLRGGGGARFGIARMVGLPDSPDRAEGHTVSGVWGAPIVAGSAGIRFAQRLTLELFAESGWVVLPIRGVVRGGPDARVEGAFVGGGIAFGMEL